VSETVTIRPFRRRRSYAHPKLAPSRARFSTGSIAIVVGALALGGILRMNGALVAGQVGDVSAYRDHVEVLRTGGSVYRQAWVYPYFPGWLDLEWLGWRVAAILRVEFWLIIRLLVIVADLLVCLAIWWIATSWSGVRRGTWAAVIYALNPIAILVNGYHGQFDTIPTLLGLVAFAIARQGKSAAQTGALTGLAVAVKPFPALIAPAFVRSHKLSWPDRAQFVVASGLALGAVIVASVGLETPRAIESVLGYGGGPDQLLGGLLRGLWLERAHNLFLPGDFGESLARSTRWLALAVVALVWLLTWNRSIPRSAAASYLGFLSVFGAISTQYLLWPVAWLLLSDVPLVWSIAYGIATGFGAIGYYLVYWPPVILGAAGTGPPRPANVTFYIAGEALCWTVVLVVFVATIGLPRAAGRWWKYAVGANLIAVVVTALPVASQVIWLIGEWIAFRG
jgi:hypothetical protein